MLLLFSVPACALVYAQDSPEDVVRSFTEAYNEHDVDRMQDFVSDNVHWMSVQADKVNVETTGKKELVASMSSYFEGLPTTRSTLHSIRTLGEFVTLIEESQWEAKGAKKSQCAVSVYELKDGLILNVWYFAARTCERAATE